MGGFCEHHEEEALALLEYASNLLHSPVPFLPEGVRKAHQEVTKAWMERYEALIESLEEDD